jgi:hypothetical protein
MTATITPVKWTPLTAAGTPAPHVTANQPVTTLDGPTVVQVYGWQVTAGLAVTARVREDSQDNDQYRYDVLHSPSGRILVGLLCHRHTDRAVEVLSGMGVDWTQPAEVVRAELAARKTRGVIPGWPDYDCQTCCSLRAVLPAGSRPWLEQADRIRVLVDAGEYPWVRWRGGGRTRWMVQAVGDGVVDVVFGDVGHTVLVTDLRLGQH